MFEKEAKEYADWFWGASPSAQRAIKQAYQQGAEYVYNNCNKQLTKAKEIIRDLLQVLPKENIEGIYEITEEAEHFLREVEK